MVINGREIGLFYSVGAHCAYSDYLIKNPEDSVSSAIIQKAILMNKAWLDTRKQAGETDLPKALTRDELYALPMAVLNQLADEVAAQEKADTEVTVEVAEPKGKNGKSAAKKQG